MAGVEYQWLRLDPNIEATLAQANELANDGWEIIDTIGQVMVLGRRSLEALIDVDFVLDAINDYAPKDVLADTTRIPDVAWVPGRNVELRSVHLIDFDYQGMSMDLRFFSADRKLGPVNGKPTITAADMRDHLGKVSIVNSDWAELGTSFKTTVRGGLGIVMKPVPDSRDLYVGIMNGSGSPHYASGTLRARFGFVQYR